MCVSAGAKTKITQAEAYATCPRCTSLCLRNGTDTGPQLNLWLEVRTSTSGQLYQCCTFDQLAKTEPGAISFEGVERYGCLAEPRCWGLGARRSDHLQAHPDLLPHQPSVRKFEINSSASLW